jgi:hypothetical protein
VPEIGQKRLRLPSVLRQALFFQVKGIFFMQSNSQAYPRRKPEANHQVKLPAVDASGR